MKSAIVRASEPEIPTLPPPAPEVAWTSKRVLPVRPAALFMSELSSSPLELINASMPTVVVLVTLTRLIETAAAMFAVFAFTALAFVFAVGIGVLGGLRASRRRSG